LVRDYVPYTVSQLRNWVQNITVYKMFSIFKVIRLLEEEIMGVNARKQSQYKLVAGGINNFIKDLLSIG
jgi:hypothetical protein